MAGIVGYIAARGCTSIDTSQLITAMREEITYTGAERFDQWDNGCYAIARVHHGILNVTPQPIFNEDKSLCIVMDGEVFDYGLSKQWLIQQGHQFRFKMDNDAEYCLHLYEEYGSGAFAKLNGSFLITLYDIDSHELLLVNDRFSSRPLFYFHDGEQLVWGSQLRPLLKFQDLPRRLDLQGVFEFFALQRVLGDRTFYQDVKVLPSASSLRFRDGNLSLDWYWKMRYMNEARPEGYYVKALADKLRKAVARRTRGDHRLGILLSGGLDSRTVLAAADESKISVAFTLGDFRNKEVHIAQKIASTKGCKHVFLQRDFDYYFRLVDEAVEIGDGMQCFCHAHFLGSLSKMREESDILLHGYGLDGTFQGANLPLAVLRVVGKEITFLPILRKLNLATLPTIFANKWVAYRPPEELFQDCISNQFRQSINNSIKEILGDKAIYGSNVYNAWDYFVLHSYIKHWCFLNCLCIRPYMDERTIIFDNDLFDLYLSIPPQLRLRGRVYRKALRMIAPDLAAVPNANTGLKADMPISLEWMFSISRKVLRKCHILPCKLPHPVFTDGSWPNHGNLIRYNEKLKGLIRETLHDPECINPDLFNVKAIDSIFEKHINREGNFMYLLCLLLTFGRWHKKYGPK